METVSPTETTTYTLTAFNGWGTDSATVTVTVTRDIILCAILSMCNID